jgi:hypothetical protein
MAVMQIILLLLLLLIPQAATAEIVLFDDFEYAVDPTTNPTNPFTSTGPWTGSKATNLNDYPAGAKGKLYTRTSIPGYTGSFPGQSSSRVLKMEANNVSGGTDFYLQYHGASANSIPANVWFQFWIYINYDEASGETSGLESRHKFLYPCPTSTYGCHPKWLVSFSAVPYQSLMQTYGEGYPFPHPEQSNITEYGQAFVIMRDCDGPSYLPPSNPDTTNENKLGPNTDGVTVNNSHIPPNQWTLVKIHIDTSGNQGEMHIWVKPLGGSWSKLSEWVGGVTQYFDWPIASPGGHQYLRMPTTFGITDTELGGMHYYVDDFVIATSEASLPTYGDTTPPVRSAGSPSGTLAAGTTQTNMSLTTNEAATCRYSTTAGTAYASMGSTFSTTGGTSHSTTISGLTDGSGYSYYVRCIDGEGNANADDYTISWSVGVPDAVYLRTATFRLVSRSGSAWANLSNLKWAWFDNLPGSMSAPTDQGADGSTNSTGHIILTLPGSSLSDGGIGFPVVSNTDGTLSQSPPHRMHAAPRAVTVVEVEE